MPLKRYIFYPISILVTNSQQQNKQLTNNESETKVRGCYEESSKHRHSASSVTKTNERELKSLEFCQNVTHHRTY